MSEWINVEDRLPECEQVLAIYVSKPDILYNMSHDGWYRDTIYSCSVHQGKFIIESHGPIFPATHWMSLPNPPRSKE